MCGRVGRWGAGLLLAGLAACGDSPTEVATLALEPAAASLTVPFREDTAFTLAVAVRRTGPARDPLTVTVSGVPDGVTVEPLVPAGASPASVTLRVRVAPPAIIGPISTLTIRATAGALTASTTVALSVGPGPTFTLQPDSARVTIPLGGRLELGVRVVRDRGFTRDVELFTSAPGGLQPVLRDRLLTGSTASTRLTIDIPATVTPGSYPVLVSGTAIGTTGASSTVQVTVPPPAGAVQLRVLPRTVVAQRGRTTTVPLVVSRVAPFTGPVTLQAIDSAGATITFAPAVIAAGDSTATLSLTLPPDAPLGPSSRRILATGVGASGGTATVPITVVETETGALAIFNDNAPINIPAGTATTVPVEFQRPPFNGGGLITLTTLINTNDGIVVRFVPNVVAGSSARAEISVPAGTAPGNYRVAFGLNLGGAIDQRPTVTVTVLPRVGERAEIRFCDPANRPTFFAVQDDNGPWRVIPRTGNDYVFDVSSDRIGVLFVRRTASNSTNLFIRLRYVTRSELADLANVECEVLFTGTRTVTVSMSGYGIGDAGLISFGQGFTDQFPRTFFTTTAAPPGPLTVRLTRYGGENGRRVLRDVVIRRNLTESQTNPMAPVEFGGPEAIPAVPITATVTNLVGDSVYWSSGLQAPGVTRFFPGTFAGLYYIGPGGNAANTPHFLLSDATLPAGELQDLTATAYSGPATDIFRQASVLVRTPGDRTLTFGEVASPFSWSLVGEGDVLRPRVTGLLPGVGARAVGAAIRQPLTTLSSIIIDMTATSSWLGGSRFDLTLPDLRGLPGWESFYGMRRGVRTDVFEDTYGTSGGSIWQPPFDGIRLTRTTRARAISP